MKKTLAQYFNSYSPDHLSIAQKANIYKGFLEKRQNNQNKSWVRVYKSIAYSISTIAVISTILFGNFFGIFEHKPSDMGQFVVAQTIGKILSSEGTFTIYNKDSRTIAWNSIEISDRVVVDEHSQVDILVHDSFVAQVFGPAQFEIILGEDKESYNLKFINGGDNIEINSINEVNKNISIQTSDGVVIKNNDKSQKLSFSVKKDPTDGQRSIINQSNSSLEVSGNSDQSQEKVVIQPRHSVNFVKNTQDIQIISQQEIIDTPINSTDTQTTKVKNTSSEPEEQHTITNDDIKYIQQTLDKSFLNSEYHDLVMNYFVGKDNEYQITLMNINKRLNRLAPIADIDIQQATTLTELVNYSHAIIKGFTYYELDPNIYHNLTVMIKKLDELPHHEYGFLQETNKRRPIDITFIKSIISFNPNNTYL